MVNKVIQSCLKVRDRQAGINIGFGMRRLGVKFVLLGALGIPVHSVALVGHLSSSRHRGTTACQN